VPARDPDRLFDRIDARREQQVLSLRERRVDRGGGVARVRHVEAAQRPRRARRPRVRAPARTRGVVAKRRQEHAVAAVRVDIQERLLARHRRRRERGDRGRRKCRRRCAAHAGEHRVPAVARPAAHRAVPRVPLLLATGRDGAVDAAVGEVAAARVALARLAIVGRAHAQRAEHVDPAHRRGLRDGPGGRAARGRDGQVLHRAPEVDQRVAPVMDVPAAVGEHVAGDAHVVGAASQALHGRVVADVRDDVVAPGPEQEGMALAAEFRRRAQPLRLEGGVERGLDRRGRHRWVEHLHVRAEVRDVGGSLGADAGAAPSSAGSSQRRAVQVVRSRSAMVSKAAGGAAIVAAHECAFKPAARLGADRGVRRADQSAQAASTSARRRAMCGPSSRRPSAVTRMSSSMRMPPKSACRSNIA